MIKFGKKDGEVPKPEIRVERRRITIVEFEGEDGDPFFDFPGVVAPLVGKLRDLSLCPDYYHPSGDGRVDRMILNLNIELNREETEKKSDAGG